jgi:hypothetical protein
MNKKGFIAISTVLIISVVVLAISVTVSLLSIGQAQSSLALMKGEDNLQFVEGCVEDALLKSRADANYNGGTITRPEGSCLITSVSKVGNTWTTDISPSGTNFFRKIRIVFNRVSPSMTLTSWKEIQ